MNIGADEPGYRLDGLKWLAVLGLVALGVWANADAAEAGVAVLYRALAGVVLAAVALAIAVQTEKGAATWDLAREARTEIRKVVWPTTQEATQTTMIVVVVVIFVALILWALDSFFSWGVAGTIG